MDDETRRHGILYRFVEGGETVGYNLSLTVVVGPGCAVADVVVEHERLRALVREVEVADGIGHAGKRGRRWWRPAEGPGLEATTLVSGSRSTVEECPDLDAVERVVRAAGYDLSVQDVEPEGSR